MRLIKAHAYGNDFLLLSADEVPGSADRAALARTLCERHRGIGGDGLIVFTRTGRMDLLNADGSYSEVSGNGVRCLAAWVAKEQSVSVGGHVDIETDAGVKRLELLAIDGV